MTATRDRTPTLFEAVADDLRAEVDGEIRFDPGSRALRIHVPAACAANADRGDDLVAGPHQHAALGEQQVRHNVDRRRC